MIIVAASPSIDFMAALFEGERKRRAAKKKINA